MILAQNWPKTAKSRDTAPSIYIFKKNLNSPKKARALIG